MSWASISREAKKHQKNKFALVSPKQRGTKKTKFCQSTRDQGQEPAGIRPTKSDQINPIPWSLGQIWPNHVPDLVRPILAPESRSRGIRWGDRPHFSSRICSDGSRGPKIRKKKLRFIPWRFLKGTLTINSYIPYKRLAPIWREKGREG